jgi:hypothetical protein
VISFGPEVRVFVATQPIDFRKGVHGLVALVAEGLGGQPYSGDIFVFRSKQSQRLSLCTPTSQSGQSDGSIVLIFFEGLWASGDHAEGAFADGGRVERGDRDEPSCSRHQLTGG